MNAYITISNICEIKRPIASYYSIQYNKILQRIKNNLRVIQDILFIIFISYILYKKKKKTRNHFLDYTCEKFIKRYFHRII